MRVKINEDLPAVVAQLMRAVGYDAASVLEQHMAGWKDAEVWKTVQAEQRFLVTADKGFGDIRVYPPGNHAGVLILRPDEDGIRPIVELIQQTLDSYALDVLASTVTVVTPRGIRVRRPPTG